MTRSIIMQVPLNRVEGDLEVKLEITDGRVTDAWCSGTMFRGFKQLLRGRGALDGTVSTRSAIIWISMLDLHIFVLPFQNSFTDRGITRHESARK